MVDTNLLHLSCVVKLKYMAKCVRREQEPPPLPPLHALSVDANSLWNIQMFNRYEDSQEEGGGVRPDGGDYNPANNGAPV